MKMLSPNVSHRVFRLFTHQRLAHARYLSSAGQDKLASANVQPTASKYEKTEASAFQPERIKSLNIKNNLEKFKKPGSAFNHYFLGHIDKDLLSFPFLLKNRKEYLQLREQYEMVRKTWNMVKTKPENLDLLGYQSLHSLSVCEMMHIFEAIGAGEEKLLPFATKEDEEFRFEKKLQRTFNVKKFEIGETSAEESHAKTIENVKTSLNILVPLICSNAMIKRAINECSNTSLKSMISSNNAKIGLALNEEAINLPNSNTKSYWSSKAMLSAQNDFWLLSGEKTNVIDGEYDYYLVFAQTNNFIRTQRIVKNEDKQGVVPLLVPRDQVEVIHIQETPYGVKYQTIRFKEVKIARDPFELAEPTLDYCQFMNLMGCGQLASSAVVLGLLKQMLRNTYAYLINHRVGLLSSECIQYKLYQATCKLYSLESTLYLTAAMFDSFEDDSNLDAECRTVKTLAIDYGHDVVKDMRSIFGSRFPYSSSVIELISQLDCFIETTHNHRIAIGQNALANYVRINPHGTVKHPPAVIAPIYLVKQYLKYRKIQDKNILEDKEICNYTHHNLHVVGNWIHDSLKKLDYSCEFVVNHHTEHLMTKHIDLDELTKIAMNIYIMIAVLSRTNQALCYGRRNNDAEKELCIAICKELFLKHFQIFENLNRQTMSNNDIFVKNIVKASTEANGYFPTIFEVDD